MKSSRVLPAAIAISVLVATMNSSQAQTCASPLPIGFPNGPNSTVTGDTCTAANTLPSYGGTGSPQNEIVYSFFVSAPSYGAVSVVQTGGFAGTSASIFLLPTCTSSTDPINFGAAGVPMSIPPGSLTTGQTYYVVITADPGGPAGGCGQFAATATGVPVTLQQFSVD